MRIQGLIWFDDVIEKILRKHDVKQNEVREVFSGKPRFRLVEKGYRSGENVCAAMGRTDEGRYLIVFFIHKEDGRAIILSARDMTRAERRRYEKK